jgi:hypothetical protein
MAAELFNNAEFNGTQEAESTESATTAAEETGGETGSESESQETTGGEQTAEIAYSDFTVPEGFEAPNEDFLALTKELGLNQESVQKVVDYYTGKFVPGVQQAYEESQKQATEKRNTEWAAQATKDVGKEGIDKARIALKEFGGKELTDFLDNSGLGNHPLLVKLFANIGNKMSESTLITGNQTVAAEKRPADKLFGDMFNS